MPFDFHRLFVAELGNPRAHAGRVLDARRVADEHAARRASAWAVLMYRNRITEHIMIDSAELRRNPLNHRRHPDSQRHALRHLLGSVGIVDELLAYRDPEHGLTLVDGEARWSEGGSWPVAVLDLTPDEALTVLAMLDKIGADAEIDPEALIALLDSLPGEARQAAGAAWSDDELAALLADAQTLPEPGGGGDEFDPTPEDGPTRTALGDLWVIGGAHRLLVGDCTDPANVARLMGGERADMAWFDPPFGIDLQPQRGLTDAIANDGNADAREVWREFLPMLYATLHDNTVAFLCQGWTEFDWTLPLVREHFTTKSKVVWYKAQWGIGYYLRPQHEDILYCWKGTPPMPDVAISDVWEMARLNAPEHAAEKPIGLMQHAIEFACGHGGLVIDWFAGVGGTLIAAHRSGRRSFLCELDPIWADVILRRAEAEGLTVERAPA